MIVRRLDCCIAGWEKWYRGSITTQQAGRLHELTAGKKRRLRGSDIELKIVRRLLGYTAGCERSVQLHEYWKRGARLHNCVRYWLGERRQEGCWDNEWKR